MLFTFSAETQFGGCSSSGTAPTLAAPSNRKSYPQPALSFDLRSDIRSAQDFSTVAVGASDEPTAAVGKSLWRTTRLHHFLSMNRSRRDDHLQRNESLRQLIANTQTRLDCTVSGSRPRNAPTRYFGTLSK